MTSHNNDVAQNEINIRQVLMHYKKHWHWFVLSVLLCVGLSVLYFFSHTAVYNVSSTMLLRSTDENGMGQSPKVDMLSMMGLGTAKQVIDELAIINSRSIMQQSICDLDLQTEYRIKDGLRWVGQYPQSDFKVIYPECFTDTMRRTVRITLKVNGSGYKVKVKYGRYTSSTHKLKSLHEPIKTCIGDVRIVQQKPLKDSESYRFTTVPLSVLADQWRQSVHAVQVKKESNVISISTNTDMPGRAMDLMGKMIELYNNDAVVDKNVMATNTRDFIDERLGIITDELETIERDVETYKRQNSVTSLSQEASLYLYGATEYQKRRVGIETQQSILDFLRLFITDETNNDSFIPANIGVDDEALQSVVGEYNELMLNKLKIERSATADNPMLAQLAGQLSVMRKNIVASIENAARSLDIMRQDLKRQEDRYSEKIGEVPIKEREYIQIKRQQEIKQSIYMFLYQKREENALTLASAVTPAKVIDNPQIAPDVIAPKLKLLLLIAIVLGLMLPIGIIFVYDLFDNKIKEQKQYERLLKTPVLGQLIESRRSTPIVISREENSISAELFRLLRTNLRFMLPADQQSNVVLITSSVNGEGKSFVAINIALSMALLGKRVVLVGLDIRKPVLASYLGLPNQGLLTAYLSDSVYSVDDIIIPSGLDQLFDVIPAGIVPPNPNELLQTERLDELFAELRNRYEYVFVDSAPTAMVSDTFLLNRVTDMTIYVSRADYTQIEMTEYINQIYEQNRLKNMACVLNGVKTSNAGYGYGYGYGKKE